MATKDKHKERSCSSNSQIEKDRQYGFWIMQHYSKARAAAKVAK